MQVSELATVIEPILTQHGLELDQCDVTLVGKRRVVRITVDGDGPNGRGPLLDDIAQASSAVSAALDASAPGLGDVPYTLELSSRGVSTPLTHPKHFRRNRGRLLKVWLDEAQTLGRIVEATDDEVILDVDGTRRPLKLGVIKKAVVQVELNRPTEDEED